MPLRGRPPTPTEVLEINGGFTHNPARRRARQNELKSPRGIGAPPKHWMIPEPELGWIRAKKWREMWEEIKTEDPDIPWCCRGTVESLCYIKVEIRAVTSAGAGAKVLKGLCDTESKLRSDLAITRVTRGKTNASPNAGIHAPDDGLAGLAREAGGKRRA
jgi:hypothetical protein